MNSKKNPFTKLGNLGHLLKISSPLKTNRYEVAEFQKKYGCHLEIFISNDSLSINHLFLPISELSEAEYLHALIREWDETSPFIRLVCYLTCIERSLTSLRRNNFDVEGFIISLILIADIVRRKEAVAALGSKSKNQSDKILKPLKTIQSKIKIIEKYVGEDGLPDALMIDLLSASNMFNKIYSDFNQSKKYAKFDLQKMENIHRDIIIQTGGDLSLSTQIINAFLMDLNLMNIKVNNGYATGKWRHRIRERQKSRFKTVSKSKKLKNI